MERFNFSKAYASICLIDHGFYPNSVHPISHSWCDQNRHLPIPWTSSTSTKPFNSFREIKVSVTFRYRSRLRRGFLSNLSLQFMENFHVNHFNFTLPIKSDTSFSIWPFEIRILSILGWQFCSKPLPPASHPYYPQLWFFSEYCSAFDDSFAMMLSS